MSNPVIMGCVPICPHIRRWTMLSSIRDQGLVMGDVYDGYSYGKKCIDDLLNRYDLGTVLKVSLDLSLST